MSTIAAGARQIRARRAGFLRDTISVAIRALHSIPRDVEGVLVPVIFPMFWFVVNVGALHR